MSIFLHLDNVEGSVTAAGYENWIEVSDVTFPGVSSNLNMQVGKTIDRYASRPSFAPLVLLKPLDKSSTPLFEAAHNGNVFPTAEIHYASTGNPLFTYAKIILSNASITHYSERASAHGSRPEEILRMAYSQIQRIYIPRGPENQQGSPLITGYDIEQAKSM